MIKIKEGLSAYMKYTTEGIHITADLWSIDPSIIKNNVLLAALAKNAAKMSGATIVSAQCKEFQPYGMTAVILLSESHLSIHSYPEKSFIAIDCYTCGEKTDPELAIHHFISSLKPLKAYVRKLKRGAGMIRDMPIKIKLDPAGCVKSLT